MDGLRHDINPTKLGLMDCAGLADAYLIGMSEGPNFDAAMERRFQEYVEDVGTVVGNDARRRGLSDYMTGLLLPGERKSMEPIAERLESGNVSRRHQSIQHFVGEANWKDGPVRERVLGRVVPAMQKRGTIKHWIVDDTTLLKSGRHGVAIQYSGLVGTTANCQSLVSLSLATEAVSMPVACDLYLRTGRTTANAVCRPGCHPTSRFAPRSRWRSIRSATPLPPAWRAGSCWPMPLTAAPGASATR